VAYKKGETYLPKFKMNIEHVERYVMLSQILLNLCVIMKIYFVNNVGSKKWQLNFI
jgi:hypothetical protein